MQRLALLLILLSLLFIQPFLVYSAPSVDLVEKALRQGETVLEIEPGDYEISVHTGEKLLNAATIDAWVDARYSLTSKLHPSYMYHSDIRQSNEVASWLHKGGDTAILKIRPRTQNGDHRMRFVLVNLATGEYTELNVILK